MIIAISNQKGGTGKTTTCINMGKCLGELGYKILLVDLDPQGHLSFSLGIKGPKYSLSNLFQGKCTPWQVIVSAEGMDILPADRSLSDIELNLVKIENRHMVLHSILRPIEDNYDYILLDCPPSLSLLTINALCASKFVLIPTLLEALSIKGLSLLSDVISDLNKNIRHNIQIIGVLPVANDKRRNQSFEWLEYLKEKSPAYVFKNMVPLDVKLSEAPSFGKSAFSYAPKTHGVQCYREVAREFLTASALYGANGNDKVYEPISNRENKL